MTFADRIQQPDLGVCIAMRLRGVSRIYATGRNPWGGSTITYQGEVYDWSPTLLLTDDIGNEAKQMAPKAGLPAGGGWTFKVQLLGDGSNPTDEDGWLDLLQNALPRTDGKLATTITQDLDPDTEGGLSAISIVDNPWQGGSGDLALWLGDECIIVDQTGHTGTQAGYIKRRGAFGSPRRYHRATTSVLGESIPGGTGKALTDYPLRVKGLVVDVWIITGDKTYAFRPYGTSLEDAANHHPYAGVIDSVGEGGTLLTVQIKTSGLEKLIRGARPVKRTPSALAGSRDRRGDGSPMKFFIGPHNAFLHVFARSSIDREGVLINVNADRIQVGDTITIGTGVTAFTFTCVSGTPDFSSGEFAVGVDGRTQAITLANAINTPAGSGALLFAGWAGNTGNPYGVVTLKFKDTTANSAGNFPISVNTANTRAINAFPSSLGQGGGVSAASEPLVGPNPIADNNFQSRQPPFLEATTGTYFLSRLNTLLSCTITNALQKRIVGDGAPYVVHTAIKIKPDDDGRPKATIVFQLEPRNLDTTWTIELFTTFGQQDSFLRDLGFTKESYTLDFQAVDTDGDGVEASNFTQAEIEADKALSRFRWPAASKIKPTRIYVNSFASDWAETTFAFEPGYRDDNNAIIAKHAKVGEAAIVTFSSYNAVGGYLDGVQWAPSLGRGDGDEVYIECEPVEEEEVVVERVMAFPKTSFNRSLLYLLLGGYSGTQINGTYDRGLPAAWGLGIPGDLINSAKILALHDIRPARRNNLVVTQGDKMEDLIEGDLVLSGQQLVADQGQLTMFSTAAPSEAKAFDGWIITEAKLDKVAQNTGVDRSLDRLVNLFEMSAGYDNAKGDFVSGVGPNRDLVSTENFGEQDVVRVESRSIGGRGNVQAEGARSSARLFGAWGRPHGTFEEDIATLLEAWLSKVGDLVLLSDSKLPAVTGGGRGVVNLPARIYANERRYRFSSDPPARLTLVARAYAGLRWSDWAPSMQVLNTSEAEAEVATFTALDGNFTRSGDKAINHFRVGDRVRLARLGYFGTVWAAQITVITIAPGEDASTVTIDTPINLGGGEQLIVWFDQHDQGLATRQRRYVYLGSARNKLTPEEGDDVEGFSYS